MKVLFTYTFGDSSIYSPHPAATFALPGDFIRDLREALSFMPGRAKDDDTDSGQLAKSRRGK
jgi:hypothetical protein